MREYYKIKEQKCPYCSHKIDNQVCFNDIAAKPKPGDLTVCIACTNVMSFDPELSLIKFNGKLSDDDQKVVERIRSAIKQEVGLH